VDIGRSVATTPARKLVFVNGHGGNVAMLGVALREIRRRFGLMTFTMPALRVPDDPDLPAAEEGLGIHGGWAETSAVMHLRPELVHPEFFAANVPPGLGHYRHIGFNGKPIAFGWLSDDFGPSGVIGDPTTANAEAGARIFEFSRAQTLAGLQEIGRFSLPPRPGL
jgi:creatinine amidohydrolase